MGELWLNYCLFVSGEQECVGVLSVGSTNYAQSRVLHIYLFYLLKIRLKID